MASPSWKDGNDNWTADPTDDWSTGVVPGPSDAVTIAEGDPQITTDVGSIASLNLSAALSVETGGALEVTGAITNSGTLGVADGNFTDGASLTDDGTLTNTGTVNIGNGNLAGPVTVKLGALTNFVNTVVGTINLTGNASTPALAELDVSGAAGFGTTSMEVGTVRLNSDAKIQFDSGQISTIRGALALNGTATSIEDKGQGSNSALEMIRSVIGTFELENGATVTSSGALNNSGTIGVDDNNYAGGSSLHITGGTLTNSGTLNIGGGNLTSSTTVTVGGLTNYASSVLGTINLNGKATNSAVAALDVGAAAGFGQSGKLIGSVNLYSDAQIQFTTGQINTVAGELTLDGAETSILDANGASNSALGSLGTVKGSVSIEHGAALTTTVALINSGTIGVDDDNFAGGSSFHIGGKLTNSHLLYVGDSNLTSNVTVSADSLTNFVGTTDGTIDVSGSATSQDTGLANEALLSITGAAGFGTAGSLIGSVNLLQDGQIQFGSGDIDTITSGSELTLNGAMASISNDGNTNSALAQLATVTGNLSLENGATVTTTVAMSNTGTVGVDDGNFTGGSSLLLGGALTNSGTLNFGDGNLTVSDNVMADSLTNFVGTTDGTINVAGSATNQQTGLANVSLLSVSGPAGFGTTGSLIGSVNLFQAGQIQFGSGNITTITSGSELTLNGAMASISNDGNINSALTQLGTVAGSLSIENGATVSTGALTNTGTIGVDNYDFSGGSVVTFGALTNAGTLNFGDGRLTASDTITADSLTNVVGATDGTINLAGGATTNALLLSVGGMAGFGTAGSLIGSVNLYQNAQIHFASGDITTITSGSELTLNGAMASITAGSGNASAITSLSTVAGSLTLEGGASLTTGGGAGVANTLTVGNTLTVAGSVSASAIVIGAGGRLFLTNGSANGAVSVGAEATFAGTGSAGAVTVASGGIFEPGEDPGTLNTGSITLASGSSFGIEIGGTAAGTFDQDNVSGTVSLGGASFDGTLVNGFNPTPGDSFTIINNDGSDAVTGTFAGLAQGATVNIGGAEFTINYAGGDGNDVVLTDVSAACYCQGTLIRTAGGEMPIEDLTAGTMLVTASGEHRPVKWTGYRHIDIAKHPNPTAVWPVRVAADAFGRGLPARDLWMSPGHCVVVEGVLVPIRSLINETTVSQVEADAVTYWHAELDSHDVILAEGFPAESYLDTGNRAMFENGGLPMVLHPDFEPIEAQAVQKCRPVVNDGPEVRASRARLAARVAQLGFATSADPDLHILADGQRIEPTVLGPKRFAFVLPLSGTEILLMSRTFVPWHTDAKTSDSRVIGVSVKRLQIDMEDLDLREKMPGLGWHGSEERPRHVQRWTNGRAQLPAGARLVVVELAGDGRYLFERKNNVVSISAERQHA